MENPFSAEKTPDIKSWGETLNAAIVAQQDFMDNIGIPEKLENFKTAWNKALEEITTTDEMTEFMRRIPVDYIRQYLPSVSVMEKIQKKWDSLYKKPFERDDK
jgi:hypothetical protein